MDFLVIFVLVAMNGFFVASEFALVSIRKSRVEELVSEGKWGASYVRNALHDLDRYIAGTQVGITLASLGLGWVGEPVVARYLESVLAHFTFLHLTPGFVHTLAFGVAFMGITFLHVVLGELVPKSLALQQTEKVSLAVSWPMSWIVLFLHPLIWSLNGIGNAVLRLMGMPPAGAHESVHSVEELAILVNESHEAGVLDDTERQILQRSFRFGELSARDIMVRRVDITGLDLEKPRDVLLDEAAASIHSRLPAYEGSMDNIAGIIHINDLFRAYHADRMPDDLRTLCRPALVVPEAIHLDDLLDFFRKRRTQTAIVVDEYGGTAGLVTFEDVVEEVTGEIESELEAEEPAVQRLPDGRVILRGDLRLDEIESELGWTLSDEDVDTIAGLIMNRLGRVARVDDEVPTEYGTLKVIDMARMRITRVAVLPRPIEEQPAERGEE